MGTLSLDTSGVEHFRGIAGPEADTDTDGVIDPVHRAVFFVAPRAWLTPEKGIVAFHEPTDRLIALNGHVGWQRADTTRQFSGTDHVPKCVSRLGIATRQSGCRRCGTGEIIDLTDQLLSIRWSCRR